jgi:hypothetical protein
MTQSVSVCGAATWCEGEQRPAAELLPTRMRGRASLLTSMLADVVARATAEAQLDPRTLPSIFGSAYGEMGTTLRLLEQLTTDGVLSPAKFQASVHNTAAGQLSIALGNREFSTSLAAGHDTLAMLLIEALAFLHQRPGHVLVACGDEASTPALQPGLVYPPLAAAMVLSNAAPPERTLARLGRVIACELGSAPASASDNPCAPALTLVAAIRAGARMTLRLNPAVEYGLGLEVDVVGAET